jgi:hypothetical protein
MLSVAPATAHKLSRPGDWRSVAVRGLARLTFAICCAMVLLMAVHGDEHGRRPRFVWRSAEDTIKVAALQVHDHTPSRSADAGGSQSALTLLSPIPSFSGFGAAKQPASRNVAAKTANYLIPFANGPPTLG